MEQLREITGELKFDVTALMPDTKVLKRGIWAKDQADAERKGARLFPQAVIVHVEKRMNAWS